MPTIKAFVWNNDSNNNECSAPSFSVQTGLEPSWMRSKGKHSPGSVARAVIERHIKPVESAKQQVISVPSPATRKVNQRVNQVCHTGQAGFQSKAVHRKERHAKARPVIGFCAGTPEKKSPHLSSTKSCSPRESTHFDRRGEKPSSLVSSLLLKKSVAGKKLQ